MNIQPLLQYSYTHLWRLLCILVIAYLSLAMLGGLIIQLFEHRLKWVATAVAFLLNLLAIPLYVGDVVWIIMFVINLGHWVGMY